MDKNEALSRMLPPGAHKPGKWREGVIQIWITRACDRACFGCTQGSNLRSSSKENMYITLENFEIAAASLVGYHGVVGVFGGNPALHPQFGEICEILDKYIPKEQRGLWCNNPFGKAKLMRRIFNPKYSNLNVHLDKDAYNEFKRDWPECKPCGLEKDSRHSPVHGSMMELKTLPDPADPKNPIPNNEENRWEYISRCDINQHWSGMIGQFRGQPRAWFCEIAGSQSMLMQDQKCPECSGSGYSQADFQGLAQELGIPIEDVVHAKRASCPSCNGSTYLGPDTGVTLPQEKAWWQGSMQDFADQAEFHCHRCMVPLRGYGELACSEEGIEQTTELYLPIFQPKRGARKVSIIENHSDLNTGRIKLSTDYIGNSAK